VSENKKEKYLQTLGELRKTTKGGELAFAAKLYGAFIGATTGKAKSYYWKAPTVRKYLERIVENSKKLRVDLKTYFEVMFRPPVKMEESWPLSYPPLSWLACERAREIFEYRWKELKERVEGTRMTISEYLEQISYLNVDKYFVGCFWDGGRILGEYLGRFGELSIVDVFGVFLAYEEVFTDWFLATHPKLGEFFESDEPSVIGEEGEEDALKAVCKTKVKVVLSRLRNVKFKEKVEKARERVREEELKLLEASKALSGEILEEVKKWL